MFYVPSSTSPSPVMETAKLVQKKLGQEEVCLQCVECSRIVEGKRLVRFAAVVERKEEYGIFIFMSSRIPCLQSSDLELETAIAVDSSLRCHAEAPTRQDKPHPEFVLRLQSADVNLVLEMPQVENTQMFLAEVKRAQDLQSMNAAFGALASFTWLAKYRLSRQKQQQQQQQQQAPPASENPFAADTFDPMKHMNLSDTGAHVLATDVASSSQSTWYQDDMAALSLSDTTAQKSSTLGSKNRSQSRDSLDKIVNSSRSEDLTDSMEAIQGQLGISSGAELPVGTKPVSSREKFVRQFLCNREDEFTDLRNFRVFCGTWNVNGQSPAEALHKWMVVDNEPPDIYAIGFQELDLRKEAFIFSDSPKETEWQTAVKSYLHPKAKYRKVKSIRLVGVLLIVYIQEKHVPHINFIDADSVPTGIMGFVGNKGGVSVRFTLHSTSLCFVNSHLAAHQEEYERRNQDYRDIETKTKFKQFEPPLELSEHDVVFWIGDLNYRIDMCIDDVKSRIQKQKYKQLLEGDQLYRQMKANSDVFKGYEEGLPLFDPTYKFDAGSDVYDTSEKSRVPAWCDRILWRGPGVQQLRYDSHPQLKVSDHKPVSSLFNVGVRVIDQKRYKRVYEDIMKKLDRLENDYLPQIKLDKTELVFENVKFIEPQTQVVTIANIGQVPVEFEFINKLDDQSYCRPWLKATPHKSIILAGACCEVQVEVYVEKNSAARLNCGEENLEDILVLHLTGGKDSFITVSGNYLISSFGSSIEALVQMHGPIREVPVASLIEIEQPGSLSRVDITQDGGRLYMVPKEIWKLVDFLHKYGLDKKDLFQQPGRTSEIQLIRDCLDTGLPEQISETMSVHSVAESFLLFLECLAQPVLPCEVYSQALASSNNLLLSKQLVSRLPDCHKNVFLYVCAFLRELLQNGEQNGLDIKFLSTIFGEILLRPAPSTSLARSSEASLKERKSKIREEEAKKAAFMYHFLSQDIDA
ncbi:inositol polyphosphate 5-phosphatase OCRL isoform X2 [Aplysia californica]|uniref:Inositol polyphosphate 5-phosphatase OCRL isoform X2 n=1 Tax=Aplysia californica TaxID=6500 RepID=A0ABM0JPB5_APLCA|nr:inositol polyphosphate 5-phosphatase OCRL isoform X2 [Aplysia californica]